ncbi:MAG: hypothetical protein MUE44_14690 [Oscillatoriaceae cyanobacterium Prado104]|nr:hypothetical protein [Oscillatoriaceae cyanobacterium Prado104]
MRTKVRKMLRAKVRTLDPYLLRSIEHEIEKVLRSKSQPVQTGKWNVGSIATHPTAND